MDDLKDREEHVGSLQPYVSVYIDIPKGSKYHYSKDSHCMLAECGC